MHKRLAFMILVRPHDVKLRLTCTLEGGAKADKYFNYY